MAQKVNRNIIIRDAHLIFKNFEGRKGKFNNEGDRNFCIAIDSQELYDKLYDDGWNVKERPPRDEGDEPLRFLKVKVKFGSNRPPKLWLCTKKRRKLLTESQVKELDYDEFEKVDLSIAPYDRDGMRTAYLQTGMFNILEDELEEEYSDRYSDDESYDGDDDEEGIPF